GARARRRAPGGLALDRRSDARGARLFVAARTTRRRAAAGDLPAWKRPELRSRRELSPRGVRPRPCQGTEARAARRGGHRRVVSGPRTPPPRRPGDRPRRMRALEGQPALREPSVGPRPRLERVAIARADRRAGTRRALGDHPEPARAARSGRATFARAREPR